VSNNAARIPAVATPESGKARLFFLPGSSARARKFMDNNAHTFKTYWSGQVPFIASFAVQQLRLWVSTNPWFSGHEHGAWFELPRETLDSLQADYQIEWGQLGQKLLTGQPFSFDDRRFASGNWSQPLFGSLAAFYLLNSSFLLKLLDKLLIKEKKPRERLR
jgi:polyhydroxyalkanoate synthase